MFPSIRGRPRTPGDVQARGIFTLCRRSHARPGRPSALQFRRGSASLAWAIPCGHRIFTLRRPSKIQWFFPSFRSKTNKRPPAGSSGSVPSPLIPHLSSPTETAAYWQVRGFSCDVFLVRDRTRPATPLTTQVLIFRENTDRPTSCLQGSKQVALDFPRWSIPTRLRMHRPGRHRRCHGNHEAIFSCFSLPMIQESENFSDHGQY